MIEAYGLLQYPNCQHMDCFHFQYEYDTTQMQETSFWWPLWKRNKANKGPSQSKDAVLVE